MVNKAIQDTFFKSQKCKKGDIEKKCPESLCFMLLVICWKLREKMGYQKMADLPQEKSTEAAPFTFCGVDMFGPLIIKDRRSELKRCGALFTCFSSRAMHIKVTNSLDADSLILELR